MREPDPDRRTPPAQAGRFASLPLPALLRLGAEMIAQSPQLHRDAPERAQRLAALIVARTPSVNAAQFRAPHAGCRPDQVVTGLAEIALLVMAELYAAERGAELTPTLADSRVWRRLAA